MTRFFYLTRLVPCGSATSLDIGLGNWSLKFITLTFYTMCKSSALAFVLLFAFIFRLETPSWKLILIIATMTAGVIMMVAGETAFDAIGFVLIISSAFFSGFRWGLTQILLLRHPATSNPFSTLFFLAPIMFVSLSLIALPVEGPSNVISGIGILAEKKGGFFGFLLLLFPGVLAFCMTSSEFALLQRTSVVTLSICGIFKEVVTISAAGIVFHDQLTPINVSGLIVTIASIAAYNYFKITKMRREARKDVVEHDAITSEDDVEAGNSSAPLLGDSIDRPRMRSSNDERMQVSNVGMPPRLNTEASALRREGSPASIRSNGTASPMKRARNME
jgi:solute carrier family 35 protein C2